MNRWRGVAVVAVLGAVVGQIRWAGPGPADAGRAVGPAGLPPAARPARRPAELAAVEQALLDHGLDGLPAAPRRPVYADRSPLF